MSNTRSNEEYNQFYARCPRCCKQTLDGIVTVDYCRVPLGGDGYEPLDGEQIQSSVVAVECRECGCRGDGSYYYSGTPEPLREVP